MSSRKSVTCRDKYKYQNINPFIYADWTDYHRAHWIEYLYHDSNGMSNSLFRLLIDTQMKSKWSRNIQLNYFGWFELFYVFNKHWQRCKTSVSLNNQYLCFYLIYLYHHRTHTGIWNFIYDNNTIKPKDLLLIFFNSITIFLIHTSDFFFRYLSFQIIMINLMKAKF